MLPSLACATHQQCSALPVEDIAEARCWSICSVHGALPDQATAKTIPATTGVRKERRRHSKTAFSRQEKLCIFISSHPQGMSRTFVQDREAPSTCEVTRRARDDSSAAARCRIIDARTSGARISVEAAVIPTAHWFNEIRISEHMMRDHRRETYQSAIDAVLRGMTGST